jgi:hypothetical protein
MSYIPTREHCRVLTTPIEIPQVATSAARNICTSPLSIMLKTKVRNVSMARLPWEELLVLLLRSGRPTSLMRPLPVNLHIFTRRWLS